MRRTPLKRRSNRPVRRSGGAEQNPEYLDVVREWPCVLHASGDCDGAIEAAHVGDRGLGQKSKDEEAIPLCAGHHRTGPDSQHVMGKKFWAHHEINRADLIAVMQGIFENTGAGEWKR